MSDTTNLSCAEVEERMSEILDGTAPDNLYDHIADCDACRDARHEAERLGALVKDAGGDHVAPADFEQRVLAALDARGDAPAPVSMATDAGPRTEPLPRLAEPLPPREEPTPREEPAPRTQPLPNLTEPLPPREEPAPRTERAATPDAVATKDEPRAASRRTDTPEKSPAPVLQIGRRKVWLAVAVSGVAAAAAIALFTSKKGGPGSDGAAAAWNGTVENVAGASGLELCDADGKSCAPLAKGAAFAAGKLLRTDGRTRAELALADGTKLTLDRATELALDSAAARRAKLAHGAIVTDVAHIDGQTARIDVPHGWVTVRGTKLAVTVSGDSTSVDVSRGVVDLVDNDHRKVEVRAGEEGRLMADAPPWVESAPALGEALAWSESALEQQHEPEEVRGLGQLSAKKPGAAKEQDGAVVLASHNVKVRIAGSVARTEVDETFSNTTGDVLEGIYRFPLPPDAKIERLALEVDGKLEEGAFVDRDRAASIMRGALVQAAPQLRPQLRDEIIWVPGPWRDPALLEWQRGGRFELSIYPIPKHGARRVILAYTQVVPQSAGVRRYVYPLAYDPGGSTNVDRFDVDVEVRGNDPSFGVRSRGYELSNEKQGDVDRLKLSATHFAPSGDLVVEYALPDRKSEMTAWAYQPDAAELAAAKKATATAKGDDDGTNDQAYVAISLRPRLPRAKDDARRAFAITVDASRSMFGERFKRASAVATRLVRELDPSDRFTLLACDTECRAMPGGLREPGVQAALEAERFLGAIPPEGASDLAGAIKSARAAIGAGDGRQARIVYIGDGTPTVGPIRPAYLTREVEDAVPAGQGTVTAIAIGADSDVDSLEAVARGGGGVVLPYVPGQSTAEAAYAVLGATYGGALRDVTVDLPSGLSAVAPHTVDTIPAGGERFVVARMSGASADGTVVLRGKVAGQPFEQRYPLHLTASHAKGNAFVPRLYAAVRIADLETQPGDDAKKEAVRLSSELSVQSRYTSLLVLESQAMFRAFGLDNTKSAPEWTGEDEAESKSAKGLVALADDEGDDGENAEKAKKSPAGSLDKAESGAGMGSAWASGPAAAPPAAAAQAAPAPRAASRPMPMNPYGGGGASIAADEPWTPPPSRRRWIPMRRIWERKGSVTFDQLVPKAASVTAIADAERDADQNKDHRDAVKKLYTLYELAGDLERASQVAERWSGKDPLDPDALTARADLAARRGEREEAIRILGSVVDVRPGDVASQQRLARAFRWAGKPEEGCRYALALAQLRTKDAKSLADAVRCGRATGESRMAEDMLATADQTTRAAVDALLAKPDPFTDKLSGDLQLEASWSGGDDLDLALLHPDGDRVSWLGAPTRSVITATDVESTHREGLGLRGAKPGEYVIEITRASGSAPASGEVTVTVAGVKRTIPFRLDDARKTLGIARITMTSRLVPLQGVNRWGAME